MIFSTIAAIYLRLVGELTRTLDRDALGRKIIRGYASTDTISYHAGGDLTEFERQREIGETLDNGKRRLRRTGFPSSACKLNESSIGDVYAETTVAILFDRFSKSSMILKIRRKY
jgi:hypothetical protein